MKGTAMDALDLLAEQHAEVDTLLEKIEKTPDAERKLSLFRELADKLAAHAKIEETLFYPAVMARQTEDLLLESVEEHLSVKRVLADIMALTSVEDEHFEAKLSVMKEQLRHHAHDEEEGELFPRVRKLLSQDELDALGGEMTSMFVDLLEHEPRLGVPEETARAAPLR